MTTLDSCLVVSISQVNVTYTLQLQFGLLKPQVADLEVDRVAPARVKDLSDHLAVELGPL